MRCSFIALAAATLLSSASARGHAHRRHAHGELANSYSDNCGCTTYVTSYLVDYTPAPLPHPVANATTTIQSVKTVVPIPDVESKKLKSIPSAPLNTTTKRVVATHTSTALTNIPASLSAGPGPTPGVTIISTPGIYTIPESTITLTRTEAVCPGTTYPPGVYIQPEVIVTVTVTSQVVTCPLSPATPAAPTSTAAVVVPTYSPMTPTYSSMVPVATPGNTTSASSTTLAQSSAPAQPSATKGISHNGKPWAVAYSPYRNGGGCKTADEVETDIASIASKGFQNVRIYSTDCSGLQNVGNSAQKHGIGMIIGIFLKAGGISTGDPQVKDIIAWAKWDIVVLVVIGNESIFNRFTSATELAGYISSASGQLKSAGYNGPITTTETLNILQESGAAFCNVIDVIGVNIHPFFNAGTTADQAGIFLASQHTLAEKVCPGKKAWVLEAGWPSAGYPNGVAVPGVAEQETAIKGMLESLPGIVSFFSWINDEWKTSGMFDVEKHFGCGQLFS